MNATPAASQPLAEPPAHLPRLRLTPSEWRAICAQLGRPPRTVELAAFSAMWSEHCAYKSTRRHLPLLLRDPLGTAALRGENAGAVDIGCDTEGHRWLAVFKMESHNHPSFLAPFQGAATGVGGIVRDILSVGARPIALLNVVRCGNLAEPAQRLRLQGIVEGLSHYGNCIGVPTVGGQTAFDECYAGNPLVNAMALGVVRQDRWVPAQPRGAGDVLVYFGARTGRDGVGGASMASGVFAADGSAMAERPAVQIADPFRGKLLIEVCGQLAAAGLLVAMQDMGAAGLTSSSCEMAARAGLGAVLDLDAVPCSDAGLSAEALLLSESQERMLAVVDPAHVPQVVALCTQAGLHAAAIGQLTGDGRWVVRWRGETVADVPIAALAEGAPLLDWPQDSQPRSPRTQAPDRTVDASALPALLADPTRSRKDALWQQFDHTVQAATVALPERAAAAVVRVPETGARLALCAVSCEQLAATDAWLGGAASVAAATRKLACVGALPLGLTDGLNFGAPHDPAVMRDIVAAMRGIGDASQALRCPVVSGNVSLYNSTGEASILPTAMVGAVGLVPDGVAICPAGFVEAGDAIWLAGAFRPQRGGALAWRGRGDGTTGAATALDLQAEDALQTWLAHAHRCGSLRSARPVSTGGLAAALALACLNGHGGGCACSLPAAPDDADVATTLLGECGSSVVVTTRAGLDLASLQTSPTVALQHIGTVSADGIVQVGPWSWPVATLRTAWQRGLSALLYPDARGADA